MSKNNHLPAEDRHLEDVIYDIDLSLKHLVKYKSGTAIYFLTKIYNNFNLFHNKGKNKIFVNLKRTRTTNVTASNDYFIEIEGGFFKQFEFVGFNSLDCEDKKAIVNNHELKNQVNYNFTGWQHEYSLNLSEIDTKLKTKDDIEEYILKERNRTFSLEEERKQKNNTYFNDGIVSGVLTSGKSVNSPKDVADVINANWGTGVVNNDINQVNLFNKGNNYSTVYYDSMSNQFKINPHPNPCCEIGIEEVRLEDEPIILKNKKRKYKIVSVKEDKTIIL